MFSGRRAVCYAVGLVFRTTVASESVGIFCEV